MTEPSPAPDFPTHWQTGPDGLPIREVARVALLDPGNQVLLMRYDDPPPYGTHWTTPGGGLEPGEEYRAAALRELAEETGWTDIVLRAELTRREVPLRSASGRQFLQRERIYLARTSVHSRDISGVAAMHASDGIAAWRWWPLTELITTAERIWPADLARLIDAALADGEMNIRAGPGGS